MQHVLIVRAYEGGMYNHESVFAGVEAYRGDARAVQYALVLYIPRLACRYV